MTGEEMERAIEFLLQSQANFDARLEQTNRQVAETSRQLQIYTETQREFIQIVTRHIEAQAEINSSLRGSDRKLKSAQRELTASQAEINSSVRDSIRELAASQLRTDERLDRLAATVERFITEGRNGNSQK
jgi:chromosome segregation ATPase